MRTFATMLAIGSLAVAAPAMAQQGAAQPGGAQQGEAPQQGAQPGGAPQGGAQQGTVQGGQGVDQTQTQVAQPEVQQALRNFPQGARSSINRAAQAQGGQLVGVSVDNRRGTTYYLAQIERNGRLYEMEVTPDGKVMSWEQKTR